MAVPEQTPYIEHTGNGVTTSFSLEFQCESKDHLIVLVDEIEPPVATWSLTGGNVVFTTAPAAGKKITVQRNTPFGRATNYQSFNNSFRPPAVNKDFDWIWWKLQELGVADWILGARIDALKNYVDRKDDELKAYLMEEIRKQGVALDQLDEYYNYLMQRLAQIAVDKGWDASFVVDASGKNQQEINDILSLKTQYVTIQMFSGASDHEKFLRAIESNKNILVVAGDYTINNSDLTKMLTPKSGQFIYFEDGVRIFFDYNGIPLLNFVNSSGGGCSGYPEFIFTGQSKIVRDYTVGQYKAECGVANFRGGPHEMHTVIMRINCNNHKMEGRFKFRSLTDDRDHGMIFCINDKGDGATRVFGNSLPDCEFNNMIHGLLFAGQESFTYGNITGNKRWSHPSMPPGHVVYSTGPNGNGLNVNGVVGDIIDLGEVLDTDAVYNTGTVAPKGLRNVSFGSVQTSHFNGIFQTFEDCEDVTFKKSYWTYNGSFYSDIPQISVASASGAPCIRVNIEVDVIAPNAIFRCWEGSKAAFVDSSIKLNVICSQNSPVENVQLIRSRGRGNTYELDWTPSDLPSSSYLFPFEELQEIEPTNKNALILNIRGKNVVNSSTRVISRADLSAMTKTSNYVNRDILFTPKQDFGKMLKQVGSIGFNTAGPSNSGVWVETFQMPAEGMFILALSAYASGSGHSSAWLLNYTPSIGIRVANQISVSQETISPKVTLSSVTMDTVGLVTLTLNKTTEGTSVLNVNLTKIGTLF